MQLASRVLQFDCVRAHGIYRGGFLLISRHRNGEHHTSVLALRRILRINVVHPTQRPDQ